MSRHRLLFVTTAAFFMVVAGAYHYRSAQMDPAKKPHVFINTTPDHRFDESIRVSILAAHDRTRVQNAVVIASDLPPGETLDSWAPRLFKDLKLGQSSNGRAILYLFRPESRELKIEVSYALEPVLPDVVVERLERAAKTFTFTDRYHDFWAELINTLNIRIQSASEGAPLDDFQNWTYLSGGAGITRSDYDTSAAKLESESRQLQPNSAEYLPGSTPEATLERYTHSLKEGIGDPALPLLSSGSRVLRKTNPMNRAQLERNWGMMQAAGPAKLRASKTRALAFYGPGHPVLPVILIPDGKGHWLVHEPNSWAYFHRYENSLEVFQKFKEYPLKALATQAGIRKPEYAIYHGAEAAPLFYATDDRFSEVLHQLERAVQQSATTENIFKLAEFIYFETYDLDRALPLYRRGLSLESQRQSYRWRMLDLLVNLGRFSDYLAELDILATARPDDQALRRDREFYRQVFTFPEAEWRTGL